MFLSCPHTRPTYNNLDCKPLKLNAGVELQTFANYVWQVIDPFIYTGQSFNMTAMNVAEFLQENRDNSYVYEMLLASVQTDIPPESPGKPAGRAYIFRQRTYQTKSIASIGRQYCAGSYVEQLAPSQCTSNQTYNFFYGNMTNDISEYTWWLAGDIKRYINFPEFECKSCWRTTAFKWSDVFFVLQSLFSMYGSLMVPITIFFSLIIRQFSTEARIHKKEENMSLEEVPLQGARDY
ncbi:hypothetical protein BGX27_004538 [Mortierella sp. AM989]|nr:hypothetical protein BGX27_004538 [Mortierella sp. AM989]